MKNIITPLITSVIITLFAAPVFAQRITKEDAFNTATAFMEAHDMKGPMNIATTPPQYYTKQAKVSANTTDAFYIFNATEGFVIVSGDARTAPILGYSTSGTFDEENCPEALQLMLQNFRHQVENLPNTPSTEEDTTAPRRAAINWHNTLIEVEPLLTTHWAQNNPYNSLCPANTVTGCVATALAQVLYYFRHAHMQYEIPSYQKDWGTSEALPATTFNFSIMRDIYTADECDDSALEVARLMKYCGHAMEMNYGKNSSGTILNVEAVKKYFGYSNRAKKVSRKLYSNAQWIEMLENELSAHRPVLYEAIDPTQSGHQFIIHGVHADGMFDVNWGWGGLYDGNYDLSLLTTPDEHYDGFCIDHQMVVGLEPADNDEMYDASQPEVFFNPNNMDDYMFIGAEHTRSRTGEFNVDLRAVTEVRGGEIGHEVEITYAVFKGDDIVEIMPCTISHTIDTQTGIHVWTRTQRFGKDLTDGTYTLAVVSRTKDGEWHPIVNKDAYHIEADIYGNTLKLKKVAPTANIILHNIYTTGTPIKHSGIEVKLDIENKGTTCIVPIYICDKNEPSLCMARIDAYLDPGAREEVSLHFLYLERDEITITTSKTGAETILYTGLLFPDKETSIITHSVNNPQSTPIYYNMSGLPTENISYGFYIRGDGKKVWKR